MKQQKRKTQFLFCIFDFLINIHLIVTLKSESDPTLIKNVFDLNKNLLENQEIHDKYPDADLTVPELLQKYGYPVEIHKVVTKDGYILTLHRIPHGRRHKNVSADESRPVVFLQHGLLCSSADWLMNSVDKALGYQLADNGFDVWLGNARGNTYSREHVSLSPKNKLFWKFSFHEMGEFDFPSVIDHILKVTHKNDLYFIAHSMGTTMFYVAMSLNPEYNSKVKAMFGLGPVAYINETRSPIRVLSPFAMDFEKVTALLGEREFLPHSSLMTLLQKIVCEERFLREAICANIMFLLCGYDWPELNETMVPIILGHTPAGTSTHNVIHYLQMMNSGEFRQFDYGKRNNMKIYGKEEPPKYNLASVKAPVALYYGANDWLAVEQNVLELAKELPNVILNYKVPLSSFNHLDFLYAIDSNELLYNNLISLLKRV